MLMCDDIRQEMNGKFILIGVYSEALVVTEFPQKLALATFFRLMEDSYPSEVSITLTHKHENSDEVTTIEGKVSDIQAKGVIDIPFPALPIDVPCPGYIITTAQLNDQKYEHKTMVISAAPASPSASV